MMSREDLMQIAEQIPSVTVALARGLGKTIQETLDMVSSGSLDSARARRALDRGLDQLNIEAAKGPAKLWLRVKYVLRWWLFDGALWLGRRCR